MGPYVGLSRCPATLPTAPQNLLVSERRLHVLGHAHHWRLQQLMGPSFRCCCRCGASSSSDATSTCTSVTTHTSNRTSGTSGATQRQAQRCVPHVSQLCDCGAVDDVGDGVGPVGPQPPGPNGLMEEAGGSVCVCACEVRECDVVGVFGASMCVCV